MINVPNKLIQAARLFVSKDASRYVLNTFIVENHGAKGGCIVATDGRALFAAHSNMITFTGDDKDRENIGFFNVKKSKDEMAAFAYFGDGKWIVNDSFTKAYNGGAKYPNWRTVIPNSTDSTATELPPFNATFMNRFTTAAALLAAKNRIGAIKVYSKGLDAMLIKQTDQHEDWDWFGALMPTRAEGVTSNIPEWAIWTVESTKATGGEK